MIFELAGEGGAGGHVRDVELNRIGRSEIMSLLEQSETPLATRYALSQPERLETVLGGRGEAPPPVTVEPIETPVPPSRPEPTPQPAIPGRGDACNCTGAGDERRARP